MLAVKRMGAEISLILQIDARKGWTNIERVHILRLLHHLKTCNVEGNGMVWPVVHCISQSNKDEFFVDIINNGKCFYISSKSKSFFFRICFVKGYYDYVEP